MEHAINSMQPVPGRHYGAFINGQWIKTDKSFDVQNPAKQERFAIMSNCGTAEAESALTATVAAFSSWKNTTAAQRATLLKAWHAAIMAHQEELALAISSEMGKPILEARGEVAYAAAYVELYAEEATRVYGETFPSQHAHKRLFANRQPVGPVYAVTPWNFPAAMVTRKVAPALAAGCTVIVKPAEQSPVTAVLLAALWEKVGGPAGTFQVLTTDDPAGVSKVMFDSRAVRKLTFTGSTAVGRMLYQQSAGTIKKVSLELGGHAPFIVFHDADIDRAVDEVMLCKFRNAGQTCVCTNRIYVQRSIAEAFAARLTDRVKALKVGDPADFDTQIGPLVDRAAVEKVQFHVLDAVSKGARVLVGGKAKSGLYFLPTVLTDVAAGMEIMQEETFGPVAPIVIFDNEDEVIALANDTPYGLAAYLYTSNLSRAFRVSEKLEYGIVGINDGAPSTAQGPFGGIKDSGLGREGGKWGLEEFLDVRFVSIGLDR
ncbi:NAD-dependent succinate-semialdehyde dehydrogenase [Achromobacter seleniivolatilans]|uniref:NAD-dependent succinate-semialdehyde dehydrogenase n=1 Tax=Achromobacter seleniivolatilans TaxID=3047478 RepID=A0ABY9M561_9BURK|nr:NAD-dependent succinate-semialdehyde dehydrogenase [Achromobacter sp. R39]WMD22131.1 NAD-dependent succinate-semialdehyde dehydrogenase [Achromobacter sp. R39]